MYRSAVACSKAWHRSATHRYSLVSFFAPSRAHILQSIRVDQILAASGCLARPQLHMAPRMRVHFGSILGWGAKELGSI